METVQHEGSKPPVMARILEDGRMSRADAAVYLGVNPKTLAQHAWAGTGPRFTKVLGRAWYFKQDLDAFIAAGLRQVA